MAQKIGKKTKVFPNAKITHFSFLGDPAKQEAPQEETASVRPSVRPSVAVWLGLFWNKP